MVVCVLLRAVLVYWDLSFELDHFYVLFLITSFIQISFRGLFRRLAKGLLFGGGLFFVGDFSLLLGEVIVLDFC